MWYSINFYVHHNYTVSKCQIIFSFQAYQNIFKATIIGNNYITNISWLFTKCLLLWGWVKKFTGWSRYLHGIWFIFHYSFPCNPYTSSISMAVFGSHWSKLSSTAYELLSPPSWVVLPRITYIQRIIFSDVFGHSNIFVSDSLKIIHERLFLCVCEIRGIKSMNKNGN